MNVAAPFRVVDPTSGRALLEVVLDAAGPVLRLFNASGAAVVELAARRVLDDDADGSVTVLNNRGARGAYLSADRNGGTVAATEARGEGAGHHASLSADGLGAVVSVCDAEGRPTELRIGRGG